MPNVEHSPKGKSPEPPQEPPVSRVTRQSHCVKCSENDEVDMLLCYVCQSQYHRTCVTCASPPTLLPSECLTCTLNNQAREALARDQAEKEKRQAEKARQKVVQELVSTDDEGESEEEGAKAVTSAPTKVTSTPNVTKSNIFTKGARPKLHEDSPIQTRTLFGNTDSSQTRNDDLQKQINELKELLGASIRQNDTLRDELMHERMNRISVGATCMSQIPNATGGIYTTSNMYPIPTPGTTVYNQTSFPQFMPTYTSQNTAFTSYSPAFTTQNATFTSHNPYNVIGTTHNAPPASNNNAPGMQVIVPLTAAQIAARKVTPPLPKFDGTPSQWPIFIAAYEYSTEACNFSNQDNLLRLIPSISGTALEHISSLLTLPQCIPRAISRLKSKYGKPERIIEDQLERIRKLPPLNIQLGNSITRFADAVHNFVATIDAGKFNTYLHNPELLRELVSRLPKEFQTHWAIYSDPFPELNLIIFDQWLDNFITKVTRATNFLDEPSKKEAKRVHVMQETSKSCPACKKNCKTLAECNIFLNSTRNSKWELIHQYKICRTCLIIHEDDCKNDKRCGINDCKRRHHPLLHSDQKLRSDEFVNKSKKGKDRRTPLPIQQPIQPPKPAPRTTVRNLSHCQDMDDVLFRILPVTLSNGSKKIETFAFLDDGSSITLVDESIANELELNGPIESLCLQWTNGQMRTEYSSRRVSLNIASKNNDQHSYSLKGARTVQNLNLPKQTFDAKEIQMKYIHLRNLPLESYWHAQPMILIGADNTYVGLPLRSKEGNPNEPVALKCRLGWTVMGRQGNDNDVIKSVNVHACSCSHLDDIGIIKRPEAIMSSDEVRAQNILENTTKRISDHFETGLLWCSDEVTLPDNKSMAIKRTNCLIQRLKKNPAMSTNVHAQIAQMEVEGYIRKMTVDEERKRTSRTWYLPVFPVINPAKPNKIRLVWDAAAKCDNVSLNDMLLTGPDALPPLVQPLNRFRERKVALNGDIRQMYHQVGIRKRDQDSQRFLWPREDGTIITYVMQVMTFGATCSPSSAQYVKNLNASSFEEQYPRAVKSIVQNHYVDDLMDSCDTEDEVIQLARQVRHIHSKAGFLIRNWKSNSQRVITTLDGNESDTNLDLQSENEKVLGMWWSCKKDTFTYSFKYAKIDQNLLNLTRKPTKREVLRLVMSIFDPNGHLTHFVLQLRILLQESWRAGHDWDDQIDDTQFNVWCHWLKELPQIEKIEIPRCYLSSIDNYHEANIQLHVFVDAGKDAYAAVAFIRVQKDEFVDIAQIGAKSKVAPLEPVSIPRLELQAALIGARYAQSIKKFLSIDINETHFWSDSTTVLGWLHSRRKYKPFVAFRTAEIREITELNSWHYIATHLNVADEATKIRRKINLESNSRWFSGPDFLKKDETQWPSNATHESKYSSPEDDIIKKINVNKVLSSFIDVTRFSKYQRLLNSVGYVFRFIERKLYKRSSDNPQHLSSSELYFAETALIRLAQRDEYSTEIQFLKDGKVPVGKNNIVKLSLYLDENDIIRLESRLDYMEIPVDSRRPILLPSKHAITRLIIQNEHENCHHQFHETVLNNILKKFYIPKARRTVRDVIQSCQHCRIYNATPKVPRMSPLPLARLACYTPPFTHTGTDFFGPIPVSIGRRTEKRWGCIFTCMTTRAIHLEVAHSLSTNSFLMCFRNFTNRRGNVKHLYSDRGTNFVGCEKLLKEAIQVVDMQSIVDEISAKKNIIWHFNPPHSPNMGGAWESLIKSIKNALYAAIPSRTMSDEVLRSALIEVEFLVNSRPLTYIPINDASAPVLTPNDLLGISSYHKTTLIPDDSPETLVNSYKTSQVFANSFWKKWIQGYLPTLTMRNKWFEETPNAKPGDLVIIVDPSAKRGEWIRGKIENVSTSADGRVRSAEVRTNQGLTLRPVSKLAILNVDPSWTSNASRPLPGGSDI